MAGIYWLWVAGMDGGEVECPHCEAELEWNDNLYAFNKEKVGCRNCDRTFFVTKNIETTYITGVR